MQFPITYSTFTVPTGAQSGTTRVVLNSNGQIISYNNPTPDLEYNETFSALWMGAVYAGVQNNTDGADFTHAGSMAFLNRFGGTFPVLRITSVTTAANTDAAVMDMVPAGQTGSAANVYFLDANAATSCNMNCSGFISVVSNDASTSFNPVIVGSGGSAPSYNTNWASNNAYGSLGTVETLRFELMATGHVHVHGAFKTGSSAPASNTIFTLGNPYIPLTTKMFTWHARIAPNSNETIGTGSVSTSGAFALSSTNTGSTSPLVANSTFWVDIIYDVLS